MAFVIGFIVGAAACIAVPDIGDWMRKGAARAWRAVTVGRPRE